MDLSRRVASACADLPLSEREVHTQILPTREKRKRRSKFINSTIQFNCLHLIGILMDGTTYLITTIAFVWSVGEKTQGGKREYDQINLSKLVSIPKGRLFNDGKQGWLGL